MEIERSIAWLRYFTRLSAAGIDAATAVAVADFRYGYERNMT